ncbi:putative acetyltransferase [Desulfarculus baarsii DSM 2075]|uniref:Acetyltransferase n=1 Tax=Desulfarculus baarsii (strain ATCC 33931 / DSM 2075 / LMG 7858 / VKM B-1802 / 2st14) TaxID=644282 RepID=E1QM02_DESB2|nr:acyltransferase [Desulfarculus baarsii]ADK86587.1 putative acetyltransferase [Desulfarculus baarsii DSM 2075]
MQDHFAEKLARIQAILDAGLDAPAAIAIFELLGGQGVSAADLEHGRLYSELLPKGREPGFTPTQRHLHFLWDALDRLPSCLVVSLAFPLRQMLARRLFAGVGRDFLCEEHVRFNFGQFISLGDNVFFNRGVFLDSKGGLKIGHSVALAEDVRVFTHGHSESSHKERSYAGVVIEDYAKIYSGAVILPGARVGREAIVAAGALVSGDVPAGMVVAGAPARVIRPRRDEGRHGEELDHLWL